MRIEHYGYLGAVRDAKEKSRRNLELLKAQQAESAPSDAFLHFNLGTEYSVIGDYGSALTEFDAGVEPGQEPGRGGPRLRAGAPAATGHRAAPLRPAEPRRSPAPTRRSSGSPASPTWCSRRHWPRSPPVARTTRSATGSAASRWATRRLGSARRSAAAPTCPRISLAELHARRGELEAGHGAARLVHRRAPGRDRRDRLRTPSVLLAQRRARRRRWQRRSRPASPNLTPAARFVLAHACSSPRRDGRGRDTSTAKSWTPARQLPGPRPARRDAAQPAPLRRGRHRGAPIDEDDPFAGLACRIELWGLIAVGDVAARRSRQRTRRPRRRAEGRARDVRRLGRSRERHA